MNATNAWSAGSAGDPASVERTRLARAVVDLLLAGDWLAKCDVVAHERPLLDSMRMVLRDEARLAWARGDRENAQLYAAHVSLLDDIERRGLAAAQAEIIRAMR